MRSPDAWRRAVVRLALLAAALFGFASLAAPAAAQSCSATVSTMSFGAISTSNNTAYQSTATITVSCTGNSNQVLQLCPYLGGGASPGASGPRYMASGSSTLAFDLYQDSALSQRYANGVVVGGNAGYTVQLSSSGSGSRTITVYGRIPAGQQGVAVGSYSADLTTGSQVAYAGGYNLSDTVNCSNVGTRAITPAMSFSATATNQASCTLATSPVQFGSVTSLAAVHDATGAVSVTCSSGASFSIAMDGGANGGTSGTTRKMANGGSQVTYGLFRDSGRTTPWYNDTNGVLTGTGTGASQSFTVFGRVPVQAAPAPGTYTDSVVVTLSY